MRRTTAALIAVLLGVVAAPLSAERSEAATDGVVEPDECVVAVPDGADCGVLVVPENRAVVGSRTIEIPYVVVRADGAAHDEDVTDAGGTGKSGAPADQRNRDPLVFVNGGPGSPTVQLAGYFAVGLGLARDRDVVLLEQRGGDRSSPSLRCPTAAAALADAFTTADDPYAESEPVAAEMKDCLDEFVADGGDPRSYTVAQTAADVRDLREALGYQRWSLYGLSWSTQVMAEVARIDPDGVSAVVLDSFSAPDRDFAETAYAGLELSLAELGARSGGAYPDPYADLLTAAARLDEQPEPFDGHNPVTGEPRTYLLTGDDLVTFIHAALHDVELLPIVPFLLSRLAEGHMGVLGTLVDVGVDELTSHTLGQYWTMQCQDEVPFRVRGAGRASPLIEWLVADEVICSRLGLAPSPPSSREPVAFGQPTLVLAGTDDPVTPATVSEEAASGLPDHQFLTFAGVGHAVLLQSRCGRSIIAAWLADTRRDMSTFCDRTELAYPVLRPGDVHPAARFGQVALAAADGEWRAVALPAAFAAMCLTWTLAAAARFTVAVVGAARRRSRSTAGGNPVSSGVAAAVAGEAPSPGRRERRGFPALAVVPFVGTLFLLVAGGLIWGAYDRLPTELVVGVPPAIPWLSLLLAAGLAALIAALVRPGDRSRRTRIALAAATLLWLAFTTWFTLVLVIPT